jgi:hypothetical protein
VRLAIGDREKKVWMRLPYHVVLLSPKFALAWNIQLAAQWIDLDLKTKSQGKP